MTELFSQISVVALDLPRQPEVTTRYSQLTIDKAVPWQQAPTSVGDLPELRHSAALGRVMIAELVFDQTADMTSVQPKLELLSRMARHISDSGPEDKKRPPMVAVRFVADKIPEFKGVIESLSIRYGNVDKFGAPVIAIAELRVREASKVSFKKQT